MQKNRAAFSLDDGRIIEANDNDNVIGIIITPQTFIERGIGQAHQAVVIGIAGDVAPGIVRFDFFDRQNGFGRSFQPVCAIERAPQRPSPDWRDTIPLALLDCDSTTPDSAAPGTGGPVRGKTHSLPGDNDVHASIVVSKFARSRYKLPNRKRY